MALFQNTQDKANLNAPFADRIYLASAVILSSVWFAGTFARGSELATLAAVLIPVPSFGLGMLGFILLYRAWRDGRDCRMPVIAMLVAFLPAVVFIVLAALASQPGEDL